MTQMLERKPSALDYAFVFEIIDILLEEEKQVIKNVKDIVLEEHKKNFDMELEYVNRNLTDLGIDTKLEQIKVDYNDYKSNKLDKLIDKAFGKMDNKIKSQLLNCLNKKDLTEVINLIETIIKNEKKSKSLVSSIVRIFRTESTKMRSQLKLDIQEELREQGINIKRKWVHTLYNPQNVILDNYTPREEHLFMNGQVEDDRGYFHNHEHSTKAPGLFGLPGEDINCRCDVEYVLDESQDFS